MNRSFLSKVLSEILIWLKQAAIIFGSIFLFLLLCGAVLYYSGRPPSESKLKQTFYSHRSTFAELRKMVVSEPRQMMISDNGMGWNIPKDREPKYLELMREISADDVSRRTDQNGKTILVICVWSSGFAGDTVHSGIFWADAEPPRLVSSLDAFRRNPDSSVGVGWVFQPIEKGWYAWTDLQTGQSPNIKGCSGGEERALRLHPWLNKPA